MKTIIHQHRQTSGGNYYLTGKLLLAMPFLQDVQFAHSVIYVCGHDAHGAIGLIINKHIPNLNFKDLLTQLHLNIELPPTAENFEVYYGGSIEITRGFVLHTQDYAIDSTVMIDGNLAVTSTLEILRAIAHNRGPQSFLVCMGYTGWTAGQLENEIQENNWMIVEANPNLLFDTSLAEKWRLSMATIGVDPSILSIDSGHA